MSHTDGRKKKKNFSRKWSQTSYRWGRACCVQSGRCTTWIGVLKIMISKHQLLWFGCKLCREVPHGTFNSICVSLESLYIPLWLFLFTFCDFVVVLCPFVDISHLIRVKMLQSTREMAKILSKDYGGPQGTSTWQDIKRSHSGHITDSVLYI